MFSQCHGRSTQGQQWPMLVTTHRRRLQGLSIGKCHGHVLGTFHVLSKTGKFGVSVGTFCCRSRNLQSEWHAKIDANYTIVRLLSWLHMYSGPVRIVKGLVRNERLASANIFTKNGTASDTTLKSKAILPNRSSRGIIPMDTAWGDNTIQWNWWASRRTTLRVDWLWQG